MKPAHVQLGTYTEYGVELNEKDPKFKVGYHMTVSKYKNVLTKCYTQNWCEEHFVIKKVKTTAPLTYIIRDLNYKEIVGTFYEKRQVKNNSGLKKQSEEKVIACVSNGDAMIIHSTGLR